MLLPTPGQDPAGWVADHLGHLADGPPAADPARRGGQTAADAALAALDLAGYARRRSLVDPPARRGATVLSPYIRHGLLSLAEVVAAAAGAPPADRRRFVDEVLWQEYCRHLYARIGAIDRRRVRRVPAQAGAPWADPLPTDMECVRMVTGELAGTGWIVNQTRMWLASQWTVRAGQGWEDGEDWMFRHLLDGSRAANRYGWMWTVGALTSKPYGFSQWQVRRRAPDWCGRCPRRDDCPIRAWPAARSGPVVAAPSFRSGEDRVGPEQLVAHGPDPDVVWVTGESMGDRDPALRAFPDLPVVFVFDEPLLAGLRLRTARLVFLAECLADLATRRPVEVRLGDPAVELAGRRVGVTHAPVPGFARLVPRLEIAALAPWPWVVRPDGGDVSSYTAWARRRRVRAALNPSPA